MPVVSRRQYLSSENNTMKTIRQFISRFGFPLLLTITIGALCFANYTNNTWLSGWDTLHPEWNFSLAFERIFNGVWRTDQGLGAVAIQSHMADLPRVALLWLLHFVLPPSTLRYAFFFLMLVAGPLGIYAFARSARLSRSAAFIGSLVYLCNLGTLQHFIVPLEMFAVLYGLFPWLCLTIIKNKLFYFAFLSFFASAMSHTATLFYAYFAIIVIFMIALRPKIRVFLTLLAIILATNAYWLFPNIYAVITHGQEVREARVNQLFSPEAFAKNQAFGTIDNAVILKNFLFDWSIYNPKKEQFEDLMAAWKPHITQLPVQAIGYGIFMLSLVGIMAVIRKKSVVGKALIPVWCISFFMLLSGTPPIPHLFEKIATMFPLAGEALRFPFTKFSILYMVPFAIFAGFGFDALLTLTARKFFHTIIVIEVSLAIVITMLPAFTGHLIHPAMRIRYPTAYQEMFDWFSKQNKNERVAILPNHTFWNWVYYDWGYQGAGFLQFGIQQPILDRDYDRWNIYNEQYQRELSYAVYSKQPTLIRKVLEKYKVTWILFDTSVIAPGDNKNATLAWQIPELLSAAGLEKTIAFGANITIYRVPTNQTNLYTSLPKTLPLSIGEPYDATFTTYGAYQTTTDTLPVNRDARNARTIRVPQELPIITESFNSILDKTNPLLVLPFSLLDHAKAYIITIYSKHQQGFPPQLCILNDLTKRCEVFTRLNKDQEAKEERFLLPPLVDYGVGYTILLKSDTVGNISGSHVLYTVSVTEIDWPTEQNVQNTDHTVITNNQSFDSGWIAFQNGKLLPNHVLVNNWANGWTVKNSGTIYIFFWPQLLEWFGFLLIPLPFVFLLIKRYRSD